MPEPSTSVPSDAPDEQPSETPFPERVDLSALHATANDLRDQLQQVIVGQQSFIEQLMIALFSGGHVLIEGVPGVAKTLTANALARAVDIDFQRIQFTPDLMPSDVLGTPIFNPQEKQFVFREGPIFAQCVLIDEINRAPAKTQAALFEVMEEQQVTVDGTTYPMAQPFFVIATQNPLEHEGTYRLPEAQLDRFMLKINVGYPSVEEETDILQRHLSAPSSSLLGSVTPVVDGETVEMHRDTVRQVRVAPEVVSYIARLMHATRKHAALTLGGSPRASVMLLYSARARAALHGRDYVSPEDLQALAAPVLRHRIMLTPDQEMEGRSPDDLVHHIVQQVEVPQ